MRLALTLLLSGGRFVAFDAKSTRDVHGWSVKVSRRSPANDAAHQWEYLAEVHALGGLAFYLIYAEALDRVFVALMPFPLGKKMRFVEMIEVARDENGWWDWLRALEETGILRTCLPIAPSVPPCGQPTAPANLPGMV